MIAFCKFAYECKIHRKENIKDYHRTSFTFMFPEYKKLIYHRYRTDNAFCLIIMCLFIIVLTQNRIK